MAHILIMPRQGNTVESCIIQEWKIQEGDTVKADSAACVVETDKATFEVPAGADGQVLKILYAGGDDVPVLQPIAVIGAAGEDWQGALGAANAAPNAVQAATAPVAMPAQAVAAGAVAASTPPPTASAAAVSGAATTAGISPRARNLAARKGLDTVTLQAALPGGTGPGGRIIERDVAAALAAGPLLTAAAKAAGGMSAAGTAGSGLGGRVTAADLAAGKDAVLTAAFPASPVSGGAAPDYGEGAITETPVKGIRKLIADRMYASLAESAQFTLNAAAPAVRLQELRKRMKGTENSAFEPGLSKITINDFILYAVSRVLPSYPYMNVHKIGDLVKSYERVHLGMAVDTPRGLMVPVIRNANLLSLRQISSEAKRLAAACQEGSVKADELSGSTFTVSNLGSFGITGFTPVLNTPEVAILGVCGIELKPTACEGDITFAPHISFSLTINHQVVDGAPAARFLQALCGAVADIDLLTAVR
jgi:pyruvate dehydrogenase E2 component (dihydrolipoamide acetyltransferase)